MSTSSSASGQMDILQDPRQLAPVFEAGLQLTASNPCPGVTPSGLIPAPTTPHARSSGNPRPGPWHHSPLAKPSAAAKNGQAADQKFSSLLPDTTRPWGNLSIHSPDRVARTAAPTTSPTRGLQLAVSSHTGQGLVLDSFAQSRPAPNCSHGVLGSNLHDIGSVAASLSGRSHPSHPRIREQAALSPSQLALGPSSMPPPPAKPCPSALSSSMRRIPQGAHLHGVGGTICGTTAPAGAAPPDNPRYRRPRSHHPFRNTVTATASPYTASRGFMQTSQEQPTSLTPDRDIQNDSPAHAAFWSWAPPSQQPMGKAVCVQHAGGFQSQEPIRNAVHAQHVSGSRSASAVRSSEHAAGPMPARQLPPRPYPALPTEEAAAIPVKDEGDLPDDVKLEFKATGLQCIMEDIATLQQLQKQADLARLQTAIQLAHTSATEADIQVHPTEALLSGFDAFRRDLQQHDDLGLLAVEDIAPAASPFAPLLEEPGQPAADLLNPWIEVPAAARNHQHSSRESPTLQAWAPLTSVESVFNDHRPQECHTIAGFTTLHEAANYRPAPGVLSVIDLAKRMIGQNAVIASRSVRPRLE